MENTVRGEHMGVWTNLSDELARRQGFEAGVKGESPRIFLSDGEHKKAYLEGYKMGRESVLARAINKASEKLLK